MQPEDNKAIARRFFTYVWGKGELDVIDELASPTLFVQLPVFPQGIKGDTALKEIVKGFHTAYTDVNFHIDEEIAEGDKVVLCWSGSGISQGSLYGVPAVGKKIEWQGISIYHIVDGKVLEEKAVEDFLPTLIQLDLISQANPYE